MKSIITSNRDLQKNKQQTITNKILPTPPTTTTPPPPVIGRQFAYAMLGMHKNASDSLQQHVSSTLVTLTQVQNSLSGPIASPNQQQQQINIPSPPRTNIQKSSTLDSKNSLLFNSNKFMFSF